MVRPQIRKGSEVVSDPRESESTQQFMERRRREVANLLLAAEVGREAWLMGSRRGLGVSAPRPEDVVRLGATLLASRRQYGFAAEDGEVDAQATGIRAPGPNESEFERQSERFSWADRTPKPSSDELAELRRRQAAERERRRAISRENQWMAIPALAPAAVVLGLEGAALLATRLAGAQPARAPLVLRGREPYLRVGDNWATRAGRRAHKALKERIGLKAGWQADRAVGGTRLRPDVTTPVRASSRSGRPRQMELKPDTPSGRAAAARSVKRYEERTRNRTRPIYYNPRDYR